MSHLAAAHARATGRQRSNGTGVAREDGHALDVDAEPRRDRARPARPARARAVGSVEAGSLEDGRGRHDGVAGRAGDAAPVRVGAMDGGLHEVAADDGARDRPRVDVVARAADAAGDEGRGALAVGGLLARQRAGHGLDSAREATRSASEPATSGAAPAAPDATSRTVSFVDWSPSTLSWSHVRDTIGRSTPSSTSGDAVASVSTRQSIVAMLGWIMPTPLTTPLTVTAHRAAVRPRQRHGQGGGLGTGIGRPQRLGDRGQAASSAAKLARDAAVGWRLRRARRAAACR